MNYYNEFDKHAVAWLRQLILDGHIPFGIVDERSIEDVLPSELAGFTQCHFFAGIGGWSRALELAGWPSDRPVWTGSCPCQPFSSAGKGNGFADERHLWPAFFHLIQQCRPPIVFGEQVASADGLAWLDLVRTDVERAGYAFGAADLCAAGVGAPHIRQRLYWVAHAEQLSGRCETKAADHQRTQAERPADQRGGHFGPPVRLADLHGAGRAPWREGCAALGHGSAAGSDCSAVRMADAKKLRFGQEHPHAGWISAGNRAQGLSAGSCASGSNLRTGQDHGGWSDADWLGCRDGKWRPVEPGTFPLVDGLPKGMVRVGDQSAPINANNSPEARVMRLRGYGNAIVPELAAMFIEAVS